MVALTPAPRPPVEPRAQVTTVPADRDRQQTAVMVAGDGRVEGADLLIKAVSQAQRRPHRPRTIPRSSMPPSGGRLTPTSGWHAHPSREIGLWLPAKVTGVRVQGCLTRTARV